MATHDQHQPDAEPGRLREAGAAPLRWIPGVEETHLHTPEQLEDAAEFSDQLQPRCPAESLMLHRPCQRPAGHDGSHYHADGDGGVWSWTGGPATAEDHVTYTALEAILGLAKPRAELDQATDVWNEALVATAAALGLATEDEARGAIEERIG